MSEIQQGLLITLIGMGLVFAVIIFLWGVMALLVRVTTNNKVKKVEGTKDIELGEPLAAEMQKIEIQRQAVAAAVAVEMAISASHTGRSKKVAYEPGDSLSPWQSVHRARQLEQKNLRG